MYRGVQRCTMCIIIYYYYCIVIFFTKLWSDRTNFEIFLWKPSTQVPPHRGSKKLIQLVISAQLKHQQFQGVAATQEVQLSSTSWKADDSWARPHISSRLFDIEKYCIQSQRGCALYRCGWYFKHKVALQ